MPATARSDLPRHRPPQWLQFLRSDGQDQVLFGSNFPQLALDRCIAQVRDLALPVQVDARFLHGNARRVFGR